MWHLYFLFRPIFFFKLSPKCMLQGQLVIDGDFSAFFVFLKDLLKESSMTLKDKVEALFFITSKMQLQIGISHKQKHHLTSEEHSAWMGSLWCCIGLCRVTQTESSEALICALLNSNGCAHILQSLGSKKPVGADQGSKLTLARSGFGDYSLYSLRMCKIITDYSFTARVPKSVVFYRSYPRMSTHCIFLYFHCQVHLQGRRRGQAHMRYI